MAPPTGAVIADTGGTHGKDMREMGAVRGRPATPSTREGWAGPGSTGRGALRTTMWSLGPALAKAGRQMTAGKGGSVGRRRSDPRGGTTWAMWAAAGGGQVGCRLPGGPGGPGPRGRVAGAARGGRGLLLGTGPKGRRAGKSREVGIAEEARQAAGGGGAEKRPPGDRGTRAQGQWAEDPLRGGWGAVQTSGNSRVNGRARFCPVQQGWNETTTRAARALHPRPALGAPHRIGPGGLYLEFAPAWKYSRRGG